MGETKGGKQKKREEVTLRTSKAQSRLNSFEK
jgi:hypothetical protein